MNKWGIFSLLSAAWAVGAGIAGRGDIAGGVGLVAVALCLVWLYTRMDHIARLNYWMSVRASFRGAAGRCSECGNRSLSSDYPFCSEAHRDEHEASTAW